MSSQWMLMGGRRRWRTAAIAGICAASAAWAAAAGCGARSELYQQQTAEVDASASDVQASGDFCTEVTYDSGLTDLSIFVVLDTSLSMLEEDRWAHVTAALAAFVEHPSAVGLGVGLQLFPDYWGSNSDSAVPVVPIGKLPAPAQAIKKALAGATPFGETPTLYAFEGSVEYARAVALANPKERVVIALVTDGAPSVNGSTAEVVAAEQAALATEPRVLTYVFGLSSGFVEEFALMAAAGGTGKPILVDDGATAAQKIVDEMLTVKAALQICTFGVPIPPGVQPAATDLSARYRFSAGSTEVELPIVPDLGSCDGDGFYPDDIESPGSIRLCPVTCAKLKAAEKSQVTVTAGCGMGWDGGLPDASADTGACPLTVELSCVPACGSSDLTPPSCLNGNWTCPPGTVGTNTCSEACPAMPNGCCHDEIELVEASCVNGKWTCPPGDIPFGEPGCSPGEVCTAALPCAFGAYCDVPDDSCGLGQYHGTCKTLDGPCDGSSPQVCGCDGLNHASLCAAAQAGVDVSGDAQCPTPPSTFDCSGFWCALGSQACRRTIDFTATITNTFACIDIPPGCGDGCDCQLCEECPPSGPCGSCYTLSGAAYVDCMVNGL